MSGYLVAALAILVASPAFAEEIPLKEIWALDMPGTRDVASIEIGDLKPGEGNEELNRMRETAIAKIHQSLLSKPPAEAAMQGFVVPLRTSIAALKHIAASLRVEQVDLQPSNEEADTTLFFFARPISYRVQLTEVKRNDYEISVHYQFVPRESKEATVQFALIPLGKLPAGEYQVQFEEAPMDGVARPSVEQVRQMICRSFTFTVEPSAAAVVRSNALEVPMSTIFGHAIDGSQPISFLAPGNKTSLVTAINRHLGERWTTRPEGFVVSGSAEHALLMAKERLVDGTEPQELHDTDKLWLFFFTRMGPLTMNIESVKIEDYRIDVRYKFPKEPPGGGAMASMTHFALIPLGQREAGEYDVMIPKHKDVCDSFKFYVEESR
jgi:hypothetical protein